MSLDGFEYHYRVWEKGRKEPVAVYASNSVPPSVGTTLTFANSLGYSTPIRCTVLSVEMIPGKSPGEKRGMATYTMVNIRVDVFSEEEGGMDWVANIIP